MLWVRTERGLVVFDPDVHTYIVYDRNDGILPSANSFGTALHDSRGNLMFGSSGGLNIFRPSFIESRAAAPVIALTSLVIGGVKRPAFPARYEAEDDQNNVDIEFATLSFNRPEKNLYRYRLEGYDEDWIEAGSRRFVSYTNLEPGAYTFRVVGSNDGGKWSANEARLEIVIRPAWYQHWWFNVGLLLLVTGLVYAGVRFRIKTIEHQKAHLETQVAQRTMEVNHQKAALEKALSDLKSAEVQLIQNEKMASLGQLTAGIAHELNNPINFVSSNIQPLKRDISDVLSLLDLYMGMQSAGGIPENIAKLQEELDIKALLAEVSQLLKGIEEGATRTASIVKGLRNFSRLDQDALILTNINEGIESTLALLRSQLGTRIKVTRNLSNIPLIECFPGQLNQVFMNIMTNAIQAIEGEGEITITSTRKHDVVSICISDTGKGMTPETLQKIFDPFYTTKSVGQGTGLGLSISYGIIKKQGGSIDVISEPGQGSTFTINLPMRVAESAG
jgi:signal transduction histidine kinase